MIFFTIFVQKFANFNKMSYLCTVFDAGMLESVDKKDLKSFGPKRPCGFDPRSRYRKKSMDTTYMQVHL